MEYSKRLSLLQSQVGRNKSPKNLKAIKQNEAQLLRMSRLIDDMLDISRIETGKLEIKKEHLNFSDLIHEIALRPRPQIQAPTGNGLKIIRLDKALVYWDRFRIE